MRKLDALFVNAQSAEVLYQDLSKDFSAIETPIWLGMLANACRIKGFSVACLDCEAERLTTKESVLKIVDAKPRIAIFVVYGQNPNDGTPKMEGAIATSTMLKQVNPEIKTVFVGPHMAALPREVLATESSIDFICQNEGVYTIINLLRVQDLNDGGQLNKVKGLGFRAGSFKNKKLTVLTEEEIFNNPNSNIILNEPEEIVPRHLLGQDLPGVAWDLLPPPTKYRTSGWHSWSNNTENSPFASVYTSLGCPKKCFPSGTRVITSKGKNKNISSIKVGDKLIGFNETTSQLEETEVVKLIFNEEKECLYKISFENGDYIKCTKEHPFYVKGQWITAEQLSIGQEVYHISFTDKIAYQKKLYNPMFNEDCAKKVSKTMTSLYKEGVLKSVHLSKPGWHQEHKPYSIRPELKEKRLAEASARMKINNPMKRKEVAEKQSNTIKKMIKNGDHIPFMCTPEYWQKLEQSPNKMEQDFNEFLNKYFPNEWRFVGDGTVRFDYFSPDFININGQKKIIELHGCYWHKCADCHPEFKNIEYKRDLNRIKVYEKYGFKTLEVWQHDLLDEKSLLKKIGDFLYNGIKISSIEKIYLNKSIKVFNFECFPHKNYFVSLRGIKKETSKEYILSHNCDFCMINVINRRDNTPGISAADSNVFRYWDPKFMIGQFDKLAEMGVKNIKIADELFVLNPNHFLELSKLLIERDYGFNIWCYSRIDTCKPQYLETLKKAGVNWLALGIENPNQALRLEFTKGGFEEVKITDLISDIRTAGINIIGNYIFGLPPDTQQSMKETLDFALNNLTEAFNIYPAQALPGSPLYLQARKEGWKLPDRYAGYAFLSYHTQNTSTNNLTAEEILRARDDAWMTYHTYEPFLKLLETKFGLKARQNVEESTKIKLKRKLLGD